MAAPKNKELIKLGSYSITDFRTMTGDYIPATQESLHSVIRNFFPAHFKFNANGTGQFYGSSSYPLVLSNTETTTASAMTGYPTVMIPYPSLAGGTTPMLLVATSSWRIHQVDGNVDMGAALGSTQGISDMTVFNGNMVTSNSGAAQARYAVPAVSPTWTAIGGSTQAMYLETFGSNLYIANSVKGVATDLRLVQVVNTSWSVLGSLDLGASWYVKGMKNVDNKFLAVVGVYGAPVNNSPENYLFLWDGTYANTYFKAIKIRGIPAAHVVKDGIYYLFCNEGTDLIAFRLEGENSLTELGRMLNTNAVLYINQIANGTDALSIFGSMKNTACYVKAGFFAICTQSANGLLLWNLDTGESFEPYQNTAASIINLVSYVQTNKKFYVEEGINSSIYEFSPGVGNYKNSTGTLYQSNFIDLKNVYWAEKFNATRIKIDAIDVYYNTPPPGASDNIGITLIYDDVDIINVAFNTFTGTLTGGSVGSTKGRLEQIGAICTNFSIALSVTAATASWNLIISRIKIYYTIIE